MVDCRDRPVCVRRMINWRSPLYIVREECMETGGKSCPIRYCMVIWYDTVSHGLVRHARHA